MGKQQANDVVQLSQQDGVAFIENNTELTRLHYFDGKFLRADAFAEEQDYHRARNRLSNLAGGWGVVHGFSVSSSGDTLIVGAGFALTAAGNMVLAHEDMQAKINELIKIAAPAPVSGHAEFADCFQPPKTDAKTSNGLRIYEITVGPVEGLCGNEAVYGKLCESACATDSQHPYWREGVVVRLRPISLQLPTSSSITLGQVHLRNRIASAYFASEPWLTANALSAAGLSSNVWCNPASLYGRNEVVIGLLVREGEANHLIDAWSARRERMDSQARGYWQGRMAMRPWNVFIAQILQFQCQLSRLFADDNITIKPDGNCDDIRSLLNQTRKELEALHKKYSESSARILQQFGEKPSKKQVESFASEVKISSHELYQLSHSLSSAQLGSAVLPQHRLLLNRGFVELPPAGYLPVSPHNISIEAQCARLFGEGVQLHYHAVRADEIAHLVEEAQHLQRISLTRGLDNPKSPEQVEIFVPDGLPYPVKATAPGEWWQVSMSFAALSAFQLGFSFETMGTINAVEASDVAIAKDNIGDNIEYKAYAMAANTGATPVEQLQALIKAMLGRPFTGLARTATETGHSFTLVAQLDVEDILLEIEKLLAKYPELDANGTVSKGLALYRGIILYIAGDISADPMDIPLNSSAQIKGELLMLKTSMEVTGSLTPVGPHHTSGRIARLKLVLSNEDKAYNLRADLCMTHQGDANNGAFTLDDAQHDNKTSPVYFDWNESPRTATLSVNGSNTVIHNAIKRSLADGNETGAAAALDNDTSRKTLLTLTGLPSMPAANSTLGTRTLTMLLRLSEQISDQAFFIRARKRLFPTIDLPATTQIRAAHDWLMFRRARTHLCAPACTPQPQTSVEAFQVWHIKLPNTEAALALENALKAGDDSILQKLKPQRVGILHYRDESSHPEESTLHIQQMWQYAQPGSQVMLGRTWETAPVTGQGWQNHFRLRGMLEQIASLTQPPTRGDGALAVLPQPPAPLADNAFDGGMLIATLTTATRKALVVYCYADGEQHYIGEDGTSRWQTFTFLNDQPQGTTLLDFIKQLSANQPINYLTLATLAPPDNHAEARLKAVIETINQVKNTPPRVNNVTQLNQHDRDQLAAKAQSVEGYDEVVFMSGNG